VERIRTRLRSTPSHRAGEKPGINQVRLGTVIDFSPLATQRRKMKDEKQRFYQDQQLIKSCTSAIYYLHIY
jgi:hypothetical protein